MTNMCARENTRCSMGESEPSALGMVMICLSWYWNAMILFRVDMMVDHSSMTVFNMRVQRYAWTLKPQVARFSYAATLPWNNITRTCFIVLPLCLYYTMHACIHLHEIPHIRTTATAFFTAGFWSHRGLLSLQSPEGFSCDHNSSNKQG